MISKIRGSIPKCQISQIPQGIMEPTHGVGDVVGLGWCGNVRQDMKILREVHFIS